MTGRRIYYANDTILIAANSATENRSLAEVEKMSAQYSLLLNRSRCCFIVIKFSDGQKLRRVEETTYLGHQISEGMDIKREIHYKMQRTLRLWFSLEKSWAAITGSTKWKLQVHHAN